VKPQQPTFSLAGAGSVLIGFTSACILIGALIGWAAGSLGLVHDHRPAAIGEHVRGHEPVVTGADHHRVWRNWRHKPTLPPHF